MNWLRFNIYSLLLVSVAAVIAAVAISVSALHCPWGIAISLCAIVTLCGKAADIFGRYKYKSNLFARLVQKGTARYDRRYFIPYMGSPCMRSVVYFALCDIGHVADYPIIKKIAREESGTYEAPLEVSLFMDENRKLVFVARNKTTGEVERL